MIKRLLRRILTVSTLVTAVLLVTLTLPITLPAAAIMTLFASTRGAVATLLFILGYLWCEVIGLPFSIDQAIWARTMPPAMRNSSTVIPKNPMIF